MLVPLMILFLLAYVVYYWVYSKPLQDNEINILSRTRRLNLVLEHFKHSQGESTVNKEFKKKMNANGQFYDINEGLCGFPSIAAGLLKYKKHEWIIIGFAKDKKVGLIWVNKGENKDSVGLKHDFREFVNIAVNNDYSTIMFFHNHPNSNPNCYDCTNPSQQDLVTAESQWELCENAGINFIEYICERGVPYRYYLKVIDSLYPLSNIHQSVVASNGVSKSQNFRLQKELMRAKKVRYEIE